MNQRKKGVMSLLRQHYQVVIPMEIHLRRPRKISERR